MGFSEELSSERVWKELWNIDEYDQSLTLQDLAWATSHVKGTAIVCREKRLSYQEFHRFTTRIACFLMTHGLKSGDVVAIHMHRDERLLLAMFGVIKAGAAYLILNTDWPGKRLAYVVRDSCARFVISDHGEEKFLNAASFTYAETIKDPVPGELRPVSELRQRMLHPQESDVAALYYTSGSTGKPKGVVLSHTNMVDSTLPLKSNASICEGAMRCKSILDVMNAGYIASVLSYASSLYTGGKHVFIQKEDLEQLLPVARIMREENVDFILMTPSIMTAFLTVEEFTRELSHVREITLCGEPLTQDLADTLTGCTAEGTIINNLYGTTEAAVGLACVNVRGKRVTMGRPLANTEVFAVDSDGNRLPDTCKGQLCVKGRRVALGYHGLPELTDRKFYTDTDGIRVYRTGDFGLVNEEGEIEFLGRTDRMVKLGGVRFELAEVEYYLQQLPYIREAVALVTQINGRDLLCAAYVSSEGVLGEKIRRDLWEVIPQAMIPSVCIQVEFMPLTERGKTDYDRLTALAALAPDLPEHALNPSDETEAMICALFAQTLHTGKVAPESSFFELGGNSLGAFTVLAGLQKRGHFVSMQDFLKNPTPRALAGVISHLDRSREGTISPVERRQGGGPRSVFEAGNQAVLDETGKDEDSAEIINTLPKELQNLAKEQDILAVLPVSNSTKAYLYMKEKGITDRLNVVRVRFLMRGFCTEEEFRRRVQLLITNHPSLRSSFLRDDTGKYWQIFYKRKAPSVYYRDLRGLSETAGNRLLSGFWQVMAEAGEAFVTGCFPLPDGNTAVLVQAEHTIVDGLSIHIIQNELAAEKTADPGEDALLAYRQRHIKAGKNISGEVRDYFTPAYPVVKSPEPLTFSGKRKQEVLSLSRQETQALVKYCSVLGVTMYCFVQLSYGKALLSLLKKNEIWILHSDSGRSSKDVNELRIVGNLMNGIPVRITPDMTPAQLQKDLLFLADIRGLSDADLYERNNWFGIFEGITSRDFGPSDAGILESEILNHGNEGGNYMYMKNGCLHIVFRHIDIPERNAWYQRLKAHLYQMIEIGMEPVAGIRLSEGRKDSPGGA